MPATKLISLNARRGECLMLRSIAQRNGALFDHRGQAMADKKNVIAGEPGTVTPKSLQASDTQAKEKGWVLDCLEDDEVREALNRLHARDERTAPSRG
ncbi:hypothetical protein I6F35_12405 [Bradyrhizobium sp. BRP22]|uniref:hypothetical protein n=1 Tax=Bradyrhizobium sp. BRP22 TaxID=2793821 RepID=UPI001CD27F09|nr:hypothetical protein [Bradyrhizobium sp. BRP22]MCA1454014.1 hypothetical protein [Bradyrhizobium sp. BRP22]